jgi:hypothetical protein
MSLFALGRCPDDRAFVDCLVLQVEYRYAGANQDAHIPNISVA